jgi:hypothetical protein
MYPRLISLSDSWEGFDDGTTQGMSVSDCAVDATVTPGSVFTLLKSFKPHDEFRRFLRGVEKSFERGLDDMYLCRPFVTGRYLHPDPVRDPQWALKQNLRHPGLERSM